MPASVCIYVDNLMPRPPSGSLTDTFQMECTFDSFKKKGIKFLFHFPRGEACFKKNFARKTREGDRGRSQSRKRDGVTARLWRAVVLILEHKQQVGKIKLQGR